MSARVAAWTLLALATLAAERLSAGASPPLRMVALVLAPLLSLKAIVALEVRRAGGPALPPARLAAWSLLWIGMRPEAFAGPRRPRAGAWPLVARGAAFGAAGGLVVAAAHALRPGHPAPAWALLLLGASLALHFGLLVALAGAWRLAGFDARPQFVAPLLATSLAEFWGRRWNLAFTDMAQRAIYRPLAPALGRRAAAAVVFAFSALAHELALSVPARGGWGGPTCYFALQGLLVTVVEPRLRLRGAAARAFTLACLALPLPLLFHAPFMDRVLWPAVDAVLGAASAAPGASPRA